MLKSEVDPKARTVCMGIAGKNLVRFACIINEGRAAARPVGRESAQSGVRRISRPSLC